MPATPRDEVLYRLGQLDGRLEAQGLLMQQTHDRVLFLERKLLPMIGRRSAWVGAGSGIGATAALLSILHYAGVL